MGNKHNKDYSEKIFFINEEIDKRLPNGSQKEKDLLLAERMLLQAQSEYNIMNGMAKYATSNSHISQIQNAINNYIFAQRMYTIVKEFYKIEN